MSETVEKRLEEVTKSAKWLHCFVGPVDVKSISEDMNWLISEVERYKLHSLENGSLAKELMTMRLNLEKGNRQLLETIGGLVKAVEVYSGKPVDVAMKELIEFAEEVDKDD